MEIAIREAVREDITKIYKYMYELALYEDLMDYFTLRPEELEHIIFVKRTLCVLVVEKEGIVIGFTSYYFNRYSVESGKRIMYLEEIYIEEAERKKGYGCTVFEILRMIAKENNCKKVEWKCLACNRQAINFYNKIGASCDKTWLAFQLNKDEF